MPSSWSANSTTSTASLRLGGRFDFALHVIADRPGYLAFRVTGRDAERAFKHEAGGHRIQRVPPTEKRGRVHTSTITMCVLREPEKAEVHLADRDLDWKTTGGGGPGGQHQNKTESAVVLTHKPTGIRVRVESKSQHRNKDMALRILKARLLSRAQERQDKNRNTKRKGQVGSGMRADKRRTLALQRGQVTDHITGKKTSAKKYLRGQVDALWP